MLLFEKSISFRDQAVANTFFGRPVIKFTAQFKEVSIRRRLNDNMFDSLKSLFSIDMSMNNITELSGEIFKACKNLRFPLPNTISRGIDFMPMICIL
jgi:hypothetical protein